MSDVLAFVKDKTVLITGLINPHVVRTSEMLDLKCLVFARGKVPSEDILESAEEQGLVVLTTKATAFIKWENLIKAGKAGLYEGGGYQEKGVWRGCENCRMRTNEEPEFCAVCQQALKKLIDFYTD